MAGPVRWLGIGIGLGVAGSALFAPGRGAARRAMLRDKLRAVGSDLAHFAAQRARYLRGRARGVLHEARARLVSSEVPDDILVERVRAQLGRPLSHPRAIVVLADRGCVELRGPILAQEVAALLACVRGVRGVKQVVDRLEVHDAPGSHPSLQS
jgi:osmotically-inducible protein OsmY